MLQETVPVAEVQWRNGLATRGWRMAKRSQYSDQMPWNQGNLEIFDPWMDENQSKPLGNGEFRKPMEIRICSLQAVTWVCPPAGSSELVSAAAEAVAAMGEPATVGYINCGL